MWGGGGLMYPRFRAEKVSNPEVPRGTDVKNLNKILPSPAKGPRKGSVATQKLLDENHSTPTKHLSKQKLHATELNSYSRLLQ